jgi:N-acyl homoserine lactone hydrolase
MGLTIIPLDVGVLYNDKSNLTPRRDYGIQFKAASVMWYIEGAKKKIIVDTSFKSVQESCRLHAPLKAERIPQQEPASALAAIGVKPESIDIVVLTHLHWDHCQNHHLFPNAKFMVQREEMRYAIAPLPFHASMYEAITINMKPLWLDMPRIEMVDGDRQIADGIALVYTPGHTPGYQSVLVETQQGKIAIAGCMVPTFENWPDSDTDAYLPSSLFVDLEQYWESLQRLDRISDLILPGHDPKVFSQRQYP